MKISSENIFKPKLSLGLKRILLDLNLDLDRVKNEILFNKEYKIYSNHSIDVNLHFLTNIERAILYLEDRRFFNHNGIELRSIPRGMKRLVRRGSFGGVSTIDQQVVRISLNRFDRSFSRKFRELFLAFCINMHCSKKEIFDYYIHNAYLGYTINGCEEAANALFGRRAIDLDEEQSFFIASLFPLPFPRSIFEQYRLMKNYPFSNSVDLLDFCRSINPRWAGRLEFRIEHARKSQSFKPKSL